MQLQVLFVTVAAALLQSGHGSFVSIRMPYLNPAGVTYINNVQPEAHVAYGVPADVEAQHIGYAAAQVPAVAAVPYVKHVPTVSHVPVTKFEAQPAIVEKQLDVVKPAQVRRPAIQKQFFDIEERVVVRPAGSAVVELDQPTSKTQKGPTVIQPFYHHFEASPVAPTLPSPAISASPATSSDDENVVVENPDFRKVGPQVQTGASPAQTRNSFNGAQASEEPFVAHDPSPNVLVSPQSSPKVSNESRIHFVHCRSDSAGSESLNRRSVTLDRSEAE